MDRTTPEVVTRYFRAADAGDIDALAECFTVDGTVVDENVTFTGREEIIGWRKGLVGKWTYTSEVLGSRPLSADEFEVTVELRGDFPGGEVTLTYHFRIRDDRIAALSIAA